MNVSLTPEFEAFVGEKVSSGSYTSASEVVRAALRLLQEQDAERAARLAALRSAVGNGVAQLDQGETRPADQVFARARQKRRARGS